MAYRLARLAPPAPKIMPGRIVPDFMCESSALRRDSRTPIELCGGSTGQISAHDTTPTNVLGVVSDEDTLALGILANDDGVAGANVATVFGEIVEVFADEDLVGHGDGTSSKLGFLGELEESLDIARFILEAGGHVSLECATVFPCKTTAYLAVGSGDSSKSSDGVVQERGVRAPQRSWANEVEW